MMAVLDANTLAKVREYILVQNAKALHMLALWLIMNALTDTSRLILTSARRQRQEKADVRFCKVQGVRQFNRPAVLAVPGEADMRTV